MEMIRHHDELMQKISALIAMVKQSANENLRVLRDVKESAVLPGLRRDEIAATVRRSMM
jgi:hypothetical protein